MPTQTKPIELYFTATPNGRKVTIMLEELAVPYRLIPINIGKGDQFTPEFLAISPNNKIPAIVDPEGPDGEPISIFESGAILKYLALKFGQFYPADQREQVKVDEWLFWQVGGFGPMLGQNHHFNIYAPEKIPYAIKRYVDETQRLYGVLDKQLLHQAAIGNDYVAGEFSIADIAIIDWSNGYERQQIDIAEFPTFAAWRERMRARPGTLRGLTVTVDLPSDLSQGSEAFKVLFGQR